MEKVFGMRNSWFGTLDTVESHRLREADIVINATPLGMAGVEGDYPDFGFLDQLRPGTLLCDLVYSPSKTNLLLEGQNRGLRTLGGLPMLIYQALLADRLFLQAEFKMHGAYKRVIDNLKGKVDLL
jgi:shikimate dehydrogenase